MSILVYSYLILAVLAEIKDVNCIDVKGVYKTNNNVWFVAGQSLNMSCIATGINTSCTSFKWIFINNVFDPHISKITPRMLTHTSLNDSMLTSTVTLLNATEFSKGAWYIKCSLVNTTIACSPNVADGTSFEAQTSIWPLHNEHIPRVKVDSKNVSVDYGEGVNLTCTANIERYLDTMKINITVAWLRKDGEIVKEMITSDTIDNFTFTLFLRNVRGTSAGRYVCKIHVHNNLDSQKFEDYESVFLTVNPKLLGNEKKMYYVKPGQAFQIFCQINGDPSSLNIKWQMKTVHGIFTDISAKDNITITNEARTLNIGTFSQDEIMFICKVKNKVGVDIVQEFTLIVGTEPTLTGPEEKEVKVEPDDDVTLTCDIDVLPLNVTWTVHGTVIKANDSSYQISTKDPRLLLIKDVDFDGSRSFICSAKNAMNVKGVQQKITVHVRDSLSALWPVLGIIIVTILVAASIGVSCFIKRRKQQEIERREARELKQMNLTPSGAYGDQEDGFGDEPQRLLTA